MSFVPIATKCNGPLDAADVSIYDDRYDVTACGGAGCPRPKLDLSDQLRRCRVVSTQAILLISVNELCAYRLYVQWTIRSGSCEY